MQILWARARNFVIRGRSGCSVREERRHALCSPSGLSVQRQVSARRGDHTRGGTFPADFLPNRPKLQVGDGANRRRQDAWVCAAALSLHSLSSHSPLLAGCSLPAVLLLLRDPQVKGQRAAERAQYAHPEMLPTSCCCRCRCRSGILLLCPAKLPQTALRRSVSPQ